MLRILKFAERSSIVEEFSVLDFRRVAEFYYVKMELLLKDGSLIYMREYLSPSERHYSFQWKLSEDQFARWDNSPHYPSLETHPNRLHVWRTNQDTRDQLAVQCTQKEYRYA